MLLVQRIPPVIAGGLSRLAVPCSGEQLLAVNGYLLHMIDIMHLD